LSLAPCRLLAFAGCFIHASPTFALHIYATLMQQKGVFAVEPTLDFLPFYLTIQSSTNSLFTSCYFKLPPSVFRLPSNILEKIWPN
ncbi:hypothetical protein, partial [Syntrophomonas wolfei]|uniref:hypothetical protein n=1 Tax=Syntrophomonas wolfei TaxID=863 RepID=UPI0023F22153